MYRITIELLMDRVLLPSVKVAITFVRFVLSKLRVYLAGLPFDVATFLVMVLIVLPVSVSMVSTFKVPDILVS